MTTPAESRKHKDALNRAQSWDRSWFSRHPLRCFRVRPHIPGEVITAADKDNQTVVFYDPLASTFARVPLYSKAPLPDDERFLALLWLWFKANKKPDKLLDIPPALHLQFLQLTGNAQ